MIKIPKAYNPKEVENRIYQLWQKSGFFNPDKLPKSYKLKAKSYSIVLPPPNITGELHMGHALNAIVQDILIRQKRMAGFRALWLPGTDHAGIATQVVIEKELKKEGKTRFDLGREKFVERIWDWKKKYGNVILDQLKKLGASCDWSRKKFTLDKDYSKVVKIAFLHYYKKGWIYRGKRVINWCPACQTSLSDLELEYKKKKGELWYIKYPLVKNPKSQTGALNKLSARPSTNGIGALVPNPKQILNSKFKIQNFITVATTRPETMLGDTAVAVNPSDKRYKNLIGKKVILPLVGREIPVIAAKSVDPKFGTGAVKITPAHDLADYEISLRHKLPIFQVIDEKSKITKEAPLPYQGLSVFEARERIVGDLKKEGLLEKTQDCSHQVPICYRCKTIVELLPSEQWFLKMGKLAKMAEIPVREGKIRFHPKSFEKSYFNWLKSVRDWCISRQIWWGHQLPVWLCQTGRNSKLKKNYFIFLEKPKKCPICKKCQPKQVDDVLDTWFSSALWPFAVFGWPRTSENLVRGKPQKISDFDRFYPTDILSTARDIINLWVVRMIFSALELTKKIPFKIVYIHPTVLTITGKRMSKSLGIGVDPLELIEKYGADATRLGICWQLTGVQDIRFSEDHIVAGRKFCNKVWNATRFLLLNKPLPIYANLGSLRSPREFLRIKNLTLADKRILKVLDKTTKSINKDLENFRFGQALQRLYHFFWHDFCDKYIEISKSQIANCKSKENTIKILFCVLLNSLKILHPFMPFVTEEIYQRLPIKNKKKCLMVEEWPSAN